jgi:hypothetical protein
VVKHLMSTAGAAHEVSVCYETRLQALRQHEHGRWDAVRSGKRPPPGRSGGGECFPRVV